MTSRKILGVWLAAAWLANSAHGAGPAATAEWNPVASRTPSLGPEAGRLMVGFKTSSGINVTQSIKFAAGNRMAKFTQAQTSAADAWGLANRSGVALAGTRQLTPSKHVLFLQRILYGADVQAALAKLRADPAVEFAEIDERRFAHALPNDPLFMPVVGSSTGQWFMLTPSTVTGDASATDAVSAWNFTTGSTGTVIADVDSGFRFDHPDLLRAGFGGRLLPGYDFVGGDLDRATSAVLGTYLIANDGDGWDPDPSDPGDWIDATDQKNTNLFPAKTCMTQPSSWHGTRVAGVLGALTDNSVGIAGMTWQPYILPVRALGKCGGYDSDIIAGIEWAAGMATTGVPTNPFPADIINLSLGGTGTCPPNYQALITTLSGMGVLVVASAGNASGPVDVPGNCKGVLAVAGLRNVGTKVGYSSLGPEVGIAAPAGNCVTASGGCLRSIDTTYNTGTTVPAGNAYTDQTNFNLGTSFSAPIVSGVAALMRAVNANLTPPQLIARMQAGATAFPQPSNVAQCSSSTSSSVECACTTSTCGAGMVNALGAVQAALRPIAATTVPARIAPGTPVSLDARGSAAACGATLVSYAWSEAGGVHIVSVRNTPQVTVTTDGSSGTLTLTVTDSAQATDTAVVNFTVGTATSNAPVSAGSATSACPKPLLVAPRAPTVSEAFTPGSVVVNAAATLTWTFTNSNGFALTQSKFTQTLPANLVIAASPAPSTTCSGVALSLTGANSSSAGTGTVTLSNANIPANASCAVSVQVSSATAGSYMDAVGANALQTGPAGNNSSMSQPASLSVTAAAGGAGGSAATGSKGGGGELDGWDMLFVVGVLLAGRRHAARRPRR